MKIVLFLGLIIGNSALAERELIFPGETRFIGENEVYCSAEGRPTKEVRLARCYCDFGRKNSAWLIIEYVYTDGTTEKISGNGGRAKDGDAQAACERLKAADARCRLAQ